MKSSPAQVLSDSVADALHGVAPGLSVKKALCLSLRVRPLGFYGLGIQGFREGRIRHGSAFNDPLTQILHAILTVFLSALPLLP